MHFKASEMKIAALRQHKQGILYLVRKTDTTVEVPFVGEDMSSILAAYREIWGEEPFSIVRGSVAPATVISTT